MIPVVDLLVFQDLFHILILVIISSRSLIIIFLINIYMIDG